LALEFLALEAALVTFLWDIDDSSYCDLQHCPKDLADHARQLALHGDGGCVPARVVGGQPCPRTVWQRDVRQQPLVRRSGGRRSRLRRHRSRPELPKGMFTMRGVTPATPRLRGLAAAVRVDP
jgi:hypothetical protein